MMKSRWQYVLLISVGALSACTSQQKHRECSGDLINFMFQSINIYSDQPIVLPKIDVHQTKWIYVSDSAGFQIYTKSNNYSTIEEYLIRVFGQPESIGVDPYGYPTIRFKLNHYGIALNLFQTTEGRAGLICIKQKEKGVSLKKGVRKGSVL